MRSEVLDSRSQGGLTNFQGQADHGNWFENGTLTPVQRNFDPFLGHFDTDSESN